MKRDLCFILEDTSIYTDICLVRDDIPIFFTCVDDMERYYVALCVDMDLPRYCVVRVSMAQLSDMLQGIISMRRLFTMQEKYWDVMPVDEKMEHDKVYLKSMEEIDIDELPVEDAYFELFSDELIKYAKDIKGKVFSGEFKSLRLDAEFVIKAVNEVPEIDFMVCMYNMQVSFETRIKRELELFLNIQKAVSTKYEEEECSVKETRFVIENSDIDNYKLTVKSMGNDFSFAAAA